MTDSLDRPTAAHLPENQVRLDVALMRLAVLAVAAMGVVFAYGFPKLGHMTLPGDRVITDGWVWVTRIGQILLIGMYAAEFWIGDRRGRRVIQDVRPGRMDLFMQSSAALGVLVGLAGQEVGWHFFEAVIVCLMLASLWQVNVALSRKLRSPGLLLPLSFAGLIVMGTPLLKLPLAVPPGAPTLGWIDAFFTATSAVCTTGLAVRDTATQFTPFGQTVIGVLMQLGGLGIIIFGSMLAMLLGSRPSLRENLFLSQMLDNQPLKHVTRMVHFIVLVTLVLELAGAAAMFPFWEGSMSLRERVAMSLFHSVSAFCNAGLALYPDSLESYRYSPLAHLVVVPLSVLGGLGFPVLNNCLSMGMDHLRRRFRRPATHQGQYHKPLTQGRFSLHTKIVLVMSGCLYLYGVTALFVSQVMPQPSDVVQQAVVPQHGEDDSLTLARLGGMLVDSSFMTISAQTCGFNTMPVQAVGPAGQVTLMTLMMVGGSPVGTSGGIKTTTLALIILSIWATVRQRDEAQAFGRRIYDSVVRRATALVAALVLLVIICTLLLCLTEPFAFVDILFEAVSAASTAGLSLGITAELSTFGKLVIAVTMFLGRIGPLVLLGALVFHGSKQRPYYYPHEGVMIG